MPGRPWILEEATWKSVREIACDLAVLPWGATEPHNVHLPYGTDTFQVRHVAAEAARLAWDAGARAIVLPTIPFGVQTGQLDLPLCVNLNPSTQLAMLRDIACSLDGQGVRKLVILNGHGGNEFRALIRELQPQVGVFLCVVNWYVCVDPAPFFVEPGDHAGELETSVMQHVAPELVLPLDGAGDGAARQFRLAALRDGWAWAPRQWSQVTDDTGVGNPRAASARKGAEFVRAVAERLAGFLVGLAAADPAALYE
jgi:creatinine amidohydrolase